MDEITIRSARLEDAGPIARLDVETWQATYAGILATPYLAGLSPERRASGWANVIRREPKDVRVAVATDGDIVGFSTICPHKGFPLAYSKSDRTLNCPGHYSRFDCEAGGQQVDAGLEEQQEHRRDLEEEEPGRHAGSTPGPW